VHKNKKLEWFIDEKNFRLTHGINLTDFQCIMCLSLRDQLKKCVECQTFICVPCINRVDVFKKNEEASCPHCRIKPLICQELNRFEKNHRDRLKFKCHECREEFEFKERRKHMQICKGASNVF